MHNLDEAIRQMLAGGMPDFPPGHPIIGAGKVTRYGPKRKAWYILYEFRARSGQFVVGGSYGIWGELDSTKIQIDWKGISDEERERHARERQVAEARERNKAAQRAFDAAKRGQAQWNGAFPARPDKIETYLDRKGVEHTKGIRYFADGTVLVPMIRYDITEAQEKTDGYKGPRRLLGLQKISPDGRKLFNKGLAKEGAACRLGSAPKTGEPIGLTEGLATGLSIRMATKHELAVFVAFDAGNLIHVARILRKLYPQNPLMVFADDDAYLEVSMNNVLRENFSVTEFVTVPCTSHKCKGTVLKDGQRLPAELEISCEGIVSEDGVPGLVFAVQVVGDRLFTYSRQNAGRTYALRAAAEVGNAEVLYPAFPERNLRDLGAPKLTDFNDLHQAAGLEAVRAQLGPELERIRMSANIAAMVRAELVKRGSRVVKSGSGGGQPPNKGGIEDDFDWRGLFERFSLIFPSDTLWDAERRDIVKAQHVRLAITDARFNRWLASKNRKLVDIKDLVFEPGQDVKPPRLNLFRGMSIKPSDKGSCEKLVKLLRYLCGEHEQTVTPVSDWVLKWLAYPLQHLGAKMQTALVFHGPEGAGKNQFFNAIRQIYGEYGTLITQTELEDKFNGWLSRKLFIIANEVVSRAELRHHVGKLKNYVTESPLPIRDMWSPVRYETNHAQFAFLTNELQALFTGSEDRRYMVVWTPPAAAQEFYEEVAEEVAAGGVEALYAYLLNVELGAFNEHTKPLTTSAKDMLIEMGLSSVQLFQRQLYEGLLWPLTYSPCLVTDLYRAYCTFCARTGERNPARLNRFSPEFMRQNGVRRSVRDIDKPVRVMDGKERRRQGTVMFMGDYNQDLLIEDTRSIPDLKQAVAEWKGLLKQYLEVDDIGLSSEGRRNSA